MNLSPARALFDYVVANGDYSCNSAFVGLSDDASFESARECLGKLRQRFGDRFRATYGDHDVGKISMFGGRGGMRLASFRPAQKDLDLAPFWQMDIGNYVLIGVASSLIALPVFERETLPAEKPEWDELRAEHLDQIRQAFAAIKPAQRILLFCHDPTALPFLRREPEIERRLPQIEQTIVGHLHTNLVLWMSRLASGNTSDPFLNGTTRRLSTSLNQARHWRPFKVRLCPALAGIQLVRGGGRPWGEFGSLRARAGAFSIPPDSAKGIARYAGPLRTPSTAKQPSRQAGVAAQSIPRRRLQREGERHRDVLFAVDVVEHAQRAGAAGGPASHVPVKPYSPVPACSRRRRKIGADMRKPQFSFSR